MLSAAFDCGAESLTCPLPQEAHLTRSPLAPSTAAVQAERPSKKAAAPAYSETLGDMRALGVGSVYITCSACGSASTVNVDHKDDDVMVTSLAPHVRCAVCGRLGGVVRPDWSELRGVVGSRRPHRRFNCQNIERYKHSLESETDPAKRALLLRLLAEEEAKQTKLRGCDLWLG